MDGWITIGTKLETKEFDKQIAELEKQLQEMEQDYERALKAGARVDDAPMRKLATETEKTRNKLVGLYQQKMKLEKSGGFYVMNNSLTQAVKRASRLALSIFGIRSAYLALRRASSDLASYDKQYAANLEYIRFVLTQAIAPVLKWIVDLTATLLRYIRMIIEALFGVNIFANGSVESFNKMKKNASGVSKAVKEIKKQLTGFDEVNVLSAQNNTSGAGAGGITTPSFDLSGGEVPEWMKWIKKNRKIISSALAGIATALLLIKFGLKGIKALGIGIVVTGIIYAVQALLDYLESDTWENFGRIIQGIGIAIIGLGIAFLGLPAIVIGVMVLIFGTVVKYWDKIKEFLLGGIEWLINQTDWVKKNFGIVGEFIYNTIVGFLIALLNMFDIVINNIKSFFDGFIQFIKGVFSGDWETAWKGILQVFTSIWNMITGILGMFTGWIYDTVVQPVINLFSNLWNGIVEGAKSAWKWITDIFGRIGQWFGNVISTIIGKFRDFGIRVGEVISGAFKGVVNGILGAIERILNTPIRAINRLISIINAIPGINLGQLNTFSLPRLKVGGIVNMPNKGTMIGGAIAGESGREAVVPLTDSQQMELLGETIGRYITINANIVNTMNGRVISRELKQVQNNQDFAYNT